MPGMIVLLVAMLALRDRKFWARFPSTFIPGAGPRAVHRPVGVNQSPVPIRVRVYLALEQCGVTDPIEVGDAIVGWTQPNLVDFLIPAYRDPLEYVVRMGDDDASSCEIGCCFRYSSWYYRMRLFLLTRSPAEVAEKLDELERFLSVENYEGLSSA